MPLADFIEGYLVTLKWSAANSARAKLRRELTREELAWGSMMREELVALWSIHGVAIEAARGVPGLNRSVSWQAGHDLAFVQNGRTGFSAEDWGRDLATTLTTAAQLLGKREIRVINGVPTVDREQQKREG